MLSDLQHPLCLSNHRLAKSRSWVKPSRRCLCYFTVIFEDLKFVFILQWNENFFHKIELFNPLLCVKQNSIFHYLSLQIWKMMDLNFNFPRSKLVYLGAGQFELQILTRTQISFRHNPVCCHTSGQKLFQALKIWILKFPRYFHFCFWRFVIMSTQSLLKLIMIQFLTTASA